MKKRICRYQFANLVSVSLLLLLAGACRAAVPADDSLSSANESLRQFLQTLDQDKATRYLVSFHDLDEDASPEAIVYMMGTNWCGSGGCNTLVLKRDSDTWSLVSSVAITRPPIRVLQRTSNGWRNITVWVQGGGVLAGYEAELAYNGKSYPQNPTVYPARRLKTAVSGELAIPPSENSMFLYGREQ